MDDYQELRLRLKDWLVQLLEDKDKNPISQSEIRERMNGYLRQLLEADDRDVEPRLNIKGPDFQITSGQISLTHARMLTDMINDPAELVRLSIEVIPRLYLEGILKKEEITNSNLLLIIKEYLKIQVTNHKIREARSRGDYLPEQAVFSAPYKYCGENELSEVMRWSRKIGQPAKL